MAQEKKSKRPSENEAEAPPGESKPEDSRLDKTVPMETVPMEDDLEATLETDSGNQTAHSGADVETTTSIEASESAQPGAGTRVYRGSGSGSSGSGAPGSGGSDGGMAEEIGVDATSILASNEIGATINPRELSDQDATAWSMVVGESTDVPVQTKIDSGDPGPAGNAAVIEGSYAEQRMKRLKRVNVGALRSDASAAFDYRLVRKLGQGGMGDVFVARQGSLDRLLALKLIKPLSGKKREQLEKTGRLNEVEEERRQQFLAEAIVTGDLDHPNIVPIHDVGLTSDNHLFYAMKRVVGTPWSEVIHDKSLDENLEILLKAADAVAFAHARGVVHRDIKPENIMLGDFGVVMVMDWGLALLTAGYEKQDSILTSSGLGGTPAFMAPEMVTGPLTAITPASDIYLLGATLFLIVTGKPPHHGKDISQCLQAVKNNEIRAVPELQDSELLKIALTAMAGRPEDRYPSVEAFQAAIRQYRSRAASIALAGRAAEDLESGRLNRSYADLSRAAFRFEEALKSWSGNEPARRGLAETKIVHATAAFENGDFDLGLSLLDESNQDHRPLIEQLRAGLLERESRSHRLAVLRKVAAAMLAFILVGGAVALFAINRERRSAEDARDTAIAARAQTEVARQQAENAFRRAENERLIAELNEQEAKRQKEEAEKQRAEADRQKSIAQTQRANALAAKQEAETARDRATLSEQAAVASRARAVYEEYVSKIGLAKARLERNEAEGAREILRQVKEVSPSVAESWEWRWLWRQANQAEFAEPAAAPITDLSIAPSGRHGALVTQHGQIQQFGIEPSGRIRQPRSLALPPGTRAVAIAISADAKTIAAGTSQGDIVVIAAGQSPAGDPSHRPNPTILSAHTAAVSDLQFTPDGRLLSGSLDKTIRLWNIELGRELTPAQPLWHISPVRQVSVAASGDALTIAAAIADNAGGRVELWSLRGRGDSVTVKPIGTFVGHQDPVTAVAISSDGRQVASGDVDGNVLIWNVADARLTDYEGALRTAISANERDRSTFPTGPNSPATASSTALVDETSSGWQLVSTAPGEERRATAHQDRIRSLRFNPLGTRLLSASDDYTLKLWDSERGQLKKSLSGHGGWVVAAEFLAGENERILSASNDATLRSWSVRSYHGSFVRHQPAAGASPAKSRQTRAHGQPISSLVLSPDGTQVVTASTDHTGRLIKLDPRTFQFTEVARFDEELLREGSEFVAMSMQVDRPHQRLYVGSADATIRVWDLERAVQLGEAPQTGLNTAFAVSADGQWMLTGSSLPPWKALLWRLDPQGHSPPRVVHRLGVHQQAVTAFAIAPDSIRLVTGDRNGRCILWDARSGEPIGQPIDLLRGFRINAVQFSAQGRELLIAADDQQLSRIDLDTRAVVARFDHDGAVVQLALDPTGRHALTLSELATATGVQATATLWDLLSGSSRILARTGDREAPRSQDNERDRITSVRFDAIGRFAALGRAATSAEPARVELYEIERVAQAQSTGGRADSTSTISPNHDARLPRPLGTVADVLPIDADTILTLNNNGVFRWSLSDQRLIHSYRPHAALTQASWSFDGRWVATASRSVKIWDAATGQAVGKIESPHVGPVRSVAFAPLAQGDSRYLIVTGGDDGVARLWSWNEQTGVIEPQHEYVVGAESTVVRRVRFSPDGERILVVGDRGVARIWSWQLNRVVTIDRSDAGDFVCGTFSATGDCVAVGSNDHQVRVWRLPAGDEQPGEPVLLSGHADMVHDVKFIGNSVEQLRVMTASADDTMRLWDPRLDGDTAAGRELLSLRAHDGDVTAVDATANGDLVLSAGRDGAVILWPAGAMDERAP